VEATLGRDPKQSNSGQFGGSLEHEAALFQVHTRHKPLEVAPKGATWGDTHGLASCCIEP